MPVTLRHLYAYVRLGDGFELFTGDGYLAGVRVALGEDERGHTCSVDISDPKASATAALFAQSFEAGGIAVPSDLLRAPSEVAGGGAGAENTQIFRNLGELPGDGQLIINEAAKQGVTSIPQLAYIMATVEHETGATYKPIDEIGGLTLWYAPYYGRGYVQLTHLENYAKYKTLTGKDLVNSPDLAKEPQTAAFILAHGCKTGHFTGKSLGDYITEDGSRKDYFNARRVINGTDRAQLIAGYAEQWESRLEGFSLKNSTDNPPPETSESTPPVVPTEVVDIADLAAEAINNKGKEIVIGLGEGFENLTSFHYVHTSSTAVVRPTRLSVKGKAIRWLLARRTTNTTYQDLTLRELAQRLCDAHGLVLEMDGDGPKYAHIDQSGLSDWGLLMRECRAVGFRMTEEKNKIIIGPIRQDFIGFVILPEMVIDGTLKFSDTASADMAVNRPPSGSVPDMKAEINPLTGAIAQVNPEDSRGAPSDGITGRDKPIYGTIAVSDAEAALPTQVVGAIALSNGEVVQADALKTELSRVRGYESGVSLKMTDETLAIVPGNVIALDAQCAGPTFAREWRVGDVTHEITAEGPPTTTLTLYTPQAAVPKKSADAGTAIAGDGAQGSSAEVSEAGWVRPETGVLTSDFHTRNPRRPTHFGVDLSGGAGTEIIASRAGTVVYADGGFDSNNSFGANGGYGNYVEIDHGSGYSSRYAHMQSVLSVSPGEKVERGQKLGVEGNSGSSRGEHLHHEIRLNGTPQDPALFYDL